MMKIEETNALGNNSNETKLLKWRLLCNFIISGLQGIIRIVSYFSSPKSDFYNHTKF